MFTSVDEEPVFTRVDEELVFTRVDEEPFASVVEELFTSVDEEPVFTSVDEEPVFTRVDEEPFASVEEAFTSVDEESFTSIDEESFASVDEFSKFVIFVELVNAGPTSVGAPGATLRWRPVCRTTDDGGSRVSTSLAASGRGRTTT